MEGKSCPWVSTIKLDSMSTFSMKLKFHSHLITVLSKKLNPNIRCTISTRVSHLMSQIRTTRDFSKVNQEFSIQFHLSSYWINIDLEHCGTGSEMNQSLDQKINNPPSYPAALRKLTSYDLDRTDHPISCRAKSSHTASSHPVTIVTSVVLPRSSFPSHTMQGLLHDPHPTLSLQIQNEYFLQYRLENSV
ncbi:hypothetical protein CAEBREN_08177 [Caenorhabditis brenneri]|uniref:Uncharacterized protein n=1 Tax=Caenorhabditis brenneri TaxID=135651 RepID=G0PAH5_CAEBE|nr:hypothetical protein CAEBREN_08177 [Caenorhabditis brenneri]